MGLDHSQPPLTDLELRSTPVPVEIVLGQSPNEYLHFQGVAAAVWSITHNLGFFPGATVVNSTGQVVEGDVVYVDVNSLTITFNGSFAGSAFLS